MNQPRAGDLTNRESMTVGIAAAVYILAWLVGLGIAFSYPASDASPKTWADYLTAHQELVTLQEYLIHGLAAIALVIFAAGVRAVLVRSGASRLFTDIAFGGALAAASVSLVQASVGQVLATKAGPSGDAALVTALLGVDNQADTYKLLGLILLVVSASLALRAVRAVPAWVLWGGIIVGVLLLLGSWSFPINFAALGLALDLSLLGLLGWVGVVAFYLVRASAPRSAAV